MISHEVCVLCCYGIRRLQFDVVSLQVPQRWVSMNPVAENTSRTFYKSDLSQKHLTHEENGYKQRYDCHANWHTVHHFNIVIGLFSQMESSIYHTVIKFNLLWTNFRNTSKNLTVSIFGQICTIDVIVDNNLIINDSVIEQ